MDKQVRAMIDPGRAGQAFECGIADAEKAGRDALDRLIARLEIAAGLPIPLKAAAVRKGMPTPLHCRADTSTSLRG